MIRFLPFVFVFLSLSAFSQKGTHNVYRNVDLALKNADAVTHIEVDGSSDQLYELVRNLSSFKNLRSIALRGEFNYTYIEQLVYRLAQINKIKELKFKHNNLVTFPDEIRKLSSLERFSITGNPELDYKELFILLSSVRSLKNIELIENDLSVIPKTIKGIEHLESIYIEGNHNLDLEKAIKVLSQLEYLNEVRLPINQIVAVPNNIHRLAKLEVLDLKDNLIRELSADMADLEKLESLSIEGNIIIDPAEELQNLEGLNIKTLSLDAGLTEEERAQIERLFPNAKIMEVEPDVEEAWSGLMMTEPVIKDETIKTSGTIKVRKGRLRVYSNAYLHYPKIFKTRFFESNYDTSTFEERYADTSYVNVWKRQPDREYRNIALDIFNKGVKGEIWFDFRKYEKWLWKKTCDYTVYISKFNPEIKSFIGMKWVYIGGLSRRAFIKHYINDRYYDDVRLYYNAMDNNFTIELKHANGFERIDCYPRFGNRKTRLEQAQRIYQIRYENYNTSVQRRKDRFHRRLWKGKNSYDRMMKARWDREWENFRRTYFSSGELEMTREEWLKYYDGVVGNLDMALANSRANSDNIINSLERSGYTKESDMPTLHNHDNTRLLSSYFRYARSNRIADALIIMIDDDCRSFRVFRGALGVDPANLYFNDECNYAVIVEARNGDIGVLQAGEFAEIDFDETGTHTFELEKFNGKISTVEDIRTRLGI